MVVSLRAKLVLRDGLVFEGLSFGYDFSVSGEVVFNTGMTGYNETLTDPSYAGQILCLTYPLIGNYGVPSKIVENNIEKNFESSKIQVKGLIVNEYSIHNSHHESVKSLSDWLKEEKIPAITGIDTRALTQVLREKGTMLGKIVIGEDTDYFDPNKVNLAEEVSTKELVHYGTRGKKVLLIDCGAKNNIIHSLLKRGVQVTRIPWNYDYQSKVNNLDFDGIMISNGPGDPKMCKETISNLRKSLNEDKPIFGICLGNQLLALASGADTYKLKYGHRGQNQPVYLINEKKCFITSQNHGFVVNENTLQKDWSAWMRNANDNTNEGIRHKTKPFFSVQFHPEANPGPVDTAFLFDEFIKELK
jgi:carbamoyl-phosphate synthase small subunit